VIKCFQFKKYQVNVHTNSSVVALLCTCTVYGPTHFLIGFSSVQILSVNFNVKTCRPA
jgi:hypothetical protein